MDLETLRGIVELMVNGLASMDRPYFEFLEAE